ncbi:hypothetical protein [Hydrogenophaga sp.]|uniref:hypothetical protein n=1 Tax=Hydrogenophaga sp. TaxID=1904254 RepID=UPI002731D242|nr:hypothetical protein [Hydrogenophaga sp.]MDP2074607.1 hypothetical protein [Hydrogenophaga sp.]MDP3106424.1 hypothetical protein [Hydrogenophaga sp.]
MIIFENAGEIDVRSISTFGVSVKEGDNPIGFFGTGLKYAIAVLLRTGHKIEIQSGRTVVRFGLATEVVRGQDFEFVTMATDGGAPVSIGFTTQLGKQWELWMAYREIACNCKDESGRGFHATTVPPAEAGTTRIVVMGDAFEGVFDQGHLYILADKPAMTFGTLEVRNRRGTDLFYRGVRVMQLNKPSLYTYNLQSQITLTEDRTVKSPWEVSNRIAKGVLQSTDRRFIADVIAADNEFFESQLDFHGWGMPPSDEFIQAVGNTISDRRLKVNESAMKVWKDATRQEFTPREITLTKVQLISLQRALDFCERIGFSIRDAYPIKVVETLGSGGLGLAENNTIFIAERVFQLGGSKQLASTLIEEYVHLRHGYADMTRELQSFLFEKLVSIGEELAGEPL